MRVKNRRRHRFHKRHIFARIALAAFGTKRLGKLDVQTGIWLRTECTAEEVRQLNTMKMLMQARSEENAILPHHPLDERPATGK